MKLQELKEIVRAQLTDKQIREFGILTRKSTWEAAYKWLHEGLQVQEEVKEPEVQEVKEPEVQEVKEPEIETVISHSTPETLIEGLFVQFDNYVPFYAIAETLNLNKEQLTNLVYSLEASGKYELSTMAEPRDYTPEQAVWGVHQISGGDLFFVLKNEEVPPPKTQVQEEPMKQAKENLDAGKITLDEYAAPICKADLEGVEVREYDEVAELKRQLAEMTAVAQEYRAKLAEAEERIAEMEINNCRLEQELNASEHTRKRTQEELKTAQRHNALAATKLSATPQKTTSQPTPMIGLLVAITVAMDGITGTLKQVAKSKTGRQFVKEVKQMARAA